MKIRSLLLMTISTIPFKTPIIASAIKYEVETREENNKIPLPERTFQEQVPLETMVPPPVKVFDPHGTLVGPEGSSYKVDATPYEVNPQLPDSSRRRQLGPQKPFAPILSAPSAKLPQIPSHDYIEALPPAYVPGQQYPSTSDNFQQISQNHAYHRQGQNYQQAVSSHPVYAPDYQYAARLPISYGAPILHDYPKPQYGVTPPLTGLPYGVSYPPNYKPVANSHNSVTPPPTGLPYP